MFASYFENGDLAASKLNIEYIMRVKLSLFSPPS